ncbi:flagellar hook-basal body complex protein FliE [Clostridium uliginosum]|uniref:Flagellar hook-basal body complex protein FliE n=1 Tax=Clostridium uliginosum TaxID=119641 RepID=A0A1I1KJA4_9CLOT|nr:flagellar hook-basal body complex protein FliE [Clostridium uliginosum]SFC61054.1 flagellar hook-basal body complex protein FliE [Clostridium uliginosum]
MNISNNFDQSQVLFNKKFGEVNDNKVQDNQNSSFTDTLKDCINQVNNQQVQADSAKSSFVKGDNVSIDEVMIKGEEASLGLQFLVKTRDQLLDAYKELTRMQL